MQSACQSGGPRSQPNLFDLLKTFEMIPSSGQLKPGERVTVQVNFAPAAEVAVVFLAHYNMGWKGAILITNSKR